MPDKKIIVVMGATGAQGGGLIQAILADPAKEFTPRAVARDLNSDKAKALIAQGVEVVAADIEDAASIQKAFAGAYGAFCITFFWAHFSAEKEKEHAKNLVDAAKAGGIKHAIWSTLEDTRKWIPVSDPRMPTLQEKYKVPHFDAKGESNQLFTAAGVPTTFLNTAFYWENFIHFGLGPKKGADGVLAITFPMGDKRLPGIGSADIGKCALGIFRKPGEFIGKTVAIAGGHPTGQQMADAFTKALGQPVKYNDVPADAHRKFGFPGADEMGNMFQFKRDFEKEYCGARSIEASRALNPELQTFEQWLATNSPRAVAAAHARPLLSFVRPELSCSSDSAGR